MTQQTARTGGVVVLDGRPRYHLEDCRSVAGREGLELSVADAWEAGFSPCGLCKPDLALVAVRPVPAARPVLTVPVIPAQACSVEGRFHATPPALPMQPVQPLPAPPRKGPGLAVTAVVLAVLALTSSLVYQALHTSAGGDASASGEQDLADSQAGLGVRQDAGEQAAAAGARAQAIGTSARVGDYTIAVTKVTADAGAVLEQADTLNGPARHRYTLVNASVTYHGTGRGSPWIDLSAGIAGSDGRLYEASATSVVSPLDDAMMVDLARGGSSNVDFVMDLPASSLRGGQVVVEEGLALAANEAYWSVG